MLDEYPKELELRDGSNAIIRIATRADETRLVLFFLSVPEDQRDFVHYDLADAENLEGWWGGPNWEEAFPLVAEVGGQVVAVALLKGYRASWCNHVGESWMIVHENSRGLGLGRIMASETYGLAGELGIEKLRCEVRADGLGAIKILKQLGYVHEGILGDYIKDSSGQTHDVALMSCNIQDYLRRQAQNEEQGLPEISAAF